MPKVGSIRGSHKDKGSPGRMGSIGFANTPKGKAKWAQKTAMIKGGRANEFAEADKAVSKK